MKKTGLDVNELEYVPLTNDLLFHMVFTKNKNALRSLLSSILGIPEKEIMEITVLNPMQYTEAIDTRMTVLDLRLHLNREKYVLVEMQVRRFPSWTDRTLVYACRQIADQSKGNEFKYNTIQPVIQIAIMDYSLFPDHKRFCNKFELKDDEGYLYTKKLQFVVVDLTQSSVATEQEAKQGLVEWANAFNANNWSDVDQIQNQGVKEAMKTMELIMATPSERDLIWERRIAEIDRRTLLADAIDEGRAEGRAEGEKKMGILMKKLFEQNRMEDAVRSTDDPEYREKLYREFSL